MPSPEHPRYVLAIMAYGLPFYQSKIVPMGALVRASRWNPPKGRKVLMHSTLVKQIPIIGIMRASNDPVLTDDHRARRDVPRGHGSGADPRTAPNGDAPDEDRARTDVDPIAEDGRAALDGRLLARPERDVVEDRTALADAGMTGDDDIVGMGQPEPGSEPAPPPKKLIRGCSSARWRPPCAQRARIETRRKRA